MKVNIIYFFNILESLSECWEADWLKELFLSNNIIEYNFIRHDIQETPYG